MNASVQRTPLRIALVRLTEATAAMVGMVIERFARAEFSIVAQGEAQALVVDADRYIGQLSVAELQTQHPRLPLLLLSTHDLRLENAVTLRKPIRIQEFLAAARSLRAGSVAVEGRAPLSPESEQKAASPASSTHPVVVEQAPSPEPPAPRPPEATEKSSAGAHRPSADRPGARHPPTVVDCCGDAPDLPAAALRDPANTKSLHFDERSGLLGTLRAAARQSSEQNKTLTVLGFHDALYLTAAPSAQVVTQIDNDMLRAACETANGANLRYCSIAALPQAARSWRRIRLDSLIWDLSLWSARGRLPANLGCHDRVKLKAWPNFTRLTVTPHALRIAALWVTGYLSPVEIAGRLNVAQRYVFALCAAAEIAGLVEREPRMQPADAAAAPPTISPEDLPQIAPNPARNLFKRILGKLLHAR